MKHRRPARARTQKANRSRKACSASSPKLSNAQAAFRALPAVLRRTSPRVIIDGIGSALQELSELADVAIRFESRSRNLNIEPRQGRHLPP